MWAKNLQISIDQVRLTQFIILYRAYTTQLTLGKLLYFQQKETNISNLGHFPHPEHKVRSLCCDLWEEYTSFSWCNLTYQNGFYTNLYLNQVTNITWYTQCPRFLLLIHPSEFSTKEPDINWGRWFPLFLPWNRRLP